MVLFSEATVHGALPWTLSEYQRRVALFRFAPATACYGRSYMATGSPAWPEGLYDGISATQKAVRESMWRFETMVTQLGTPLASSTAEEAVVCRQQLETLLPVRPSPNPRPQP